MRSRVRVRWWFPSDNIFPIGIGKITSDLKRASIIKPGTDPLELANRVVVDNVGGSAAAR